ncbi:MAG: TM1802 family CRISPR-associated protein, partial [Bacteroidota bacterium]
ENQTIVGLDLESFEAQHPNFFARPVNKAAFYIGCLVEKLLEKQRKHLNEAEPFKKYLNGLNVDVKVLQEIVRRLMDKLHQYKDTDKKYDKENQYIEKLSAIAFPILLAPKDIPSKSEISYAFVTGMVMQKAFTQEVIRIAKLEKNNTASQS